MMDEKFEQQRQYFDQRCDQMETALRGEITSLREEIARSSSTFVPPYSQSTFPTAQGDASGFHQHFGGFDLQGFGTQPSPDLDFDFFSTPPASRPL
jgi:hypothetical protein